MPELSEIQREVFNWLRDEAGFAQVVSINRDGFPVGRSTVAPIADDWSVELVQRVVHKRLNQWRRNPKTEVIWSGPPKRGNRNLAPHVYDLWVQAPRVVFLRGLAEFMSDDELVESYERQTGINRAEGRVLAPLRDRERILAELVGVRIRPLQVRAEGFGDGPAAYTWKLETP